MGTNDEENGLENGKDNGPEDGMENGLEDGKEHLVLSADDTGMDAVKLTRVSTDSLAEEFGHIEQEHLRQAPAVDPESTFWQKFGFILMRRRHMKQFMCDGVLYREKKKRKVAEDELFFDLILVACFAEFGHELREAFDGWESLQKSVWFVWSSMTYILNVFGFESDYIMKYFMALIMFGLASIGLSAHTSFTSTIPWTSWSAFGLYVFISIMMIVTGAQSKKIGSKNPIKNGFVGQGITNIIAAIPYLVSAVVNTKEVAIAMFWTATGLQVLRAATLIPIYRTLASKLGQKTFIALNIEAFVERYGLITLITIGESFISLLFEAALVSTPETAGVIIGIGAFGILISYSIMTLYFDVDQKLIPGDMFAIRANAHTGVLWGILHLFYHACLILGATGLGEALFVAAKDAEEGGHEADAHIANALSGEEGGAETVVFDAKWRWLLCAGYGAAVLMSAATGALHRTGPYAITKRFRLVSRTLFTVLMLLVVLPLWGPESPLALVGLVMLMIAIMGNVEFFLVQADRLRLWPWVDYEALKEDPRLHEGVSRSSMDTHGDSLFNSVNYSGHALKAEHADRMEQ